MSAGFIKPASGTGTGTGDVVGKIEMTAGEALAQYLLVYPNTTDGKVYIASNDSEDTSDVCGIVIESGGMVQDGTGDVRFLGEVINESWTWTPLSTLILGENGALIEATDPLPAIVKPIGIALSATSAFIFDQAGYNQDPTISLPTPDVMGGRMDLVSATSIKWGFSTSNEAKLHNGTNWVYCQLATEPTLANIATDVAGTALAVDAIYDVFLHYLSPTSAELIPVKWNTSTAGSSVRYGTYAAGTTYAKGARIVDGTTYYVSLQNSNTGHTPASSPDWWVSCGSDPGTDYRGLYQCDGRWVMSPKATGATAFDGRTYRWLGVIYTYNNSSTVNFKDEENYRYVSNLYNRVTKQVRMIDNVLGSWTYNSVTPRELNGGTSIIRGNFILCQSSFLCGSFGVIESMNSSSYSTVNRVCIDSVSTSTSLDITIFSTTITPASAPFSAGPVAGNHWVSLVEFVNSASGTLTNHGWARNCIVFGLEA